MKKKFLALVLTLAMVLSLVPVTALAAGTTQSNIQNPTSSVKSEDGCVELEKTAAAVGESDNTFDITLKATVKDGKKAGEKTSTDAVLVIDRSKSMKGNRINSAQEAAKQFAEVVLGSGANEKNKIAVVSYEQEATINTELSSNLEKVKDAINFKAKGGTNIQAGIKAARDILQSSEANNKVILVLSDGEPTYSFRAVGTATQTGCTLSDFMGNHYTWNAEIDPTSVNITGFDYDSIAGSGSAYKYDYAWYYGAKLQVTCEHNKTESRSYPFYQNNGQPTIQEASYAKKAGYEIYSIYLGKPTDTNAVSTMTEIATDNDHYKLATDASELGELFKGIAKDITLPVTPGIVTDPMGDHMNLVASSLKDQNGVTIAEDGKKFTWDLTKVTPKNNEDGSRTYELTYRITFNTDFDGFDADTFYPTNKETTLAYTVQGDTNPRTANFPIPKVKGKAVTYQLTYDANGGKFDSGNTKTETIDQTGDHALNYTSDYIPTYTSEGKNHIFLGWSAEPLSVLSSASDAAENANKIITSVNVTDKGATVYAVWSLDEDGNGIPDVFEATIIYKIVNGKWTKDGAAIGSDDITATFQLYEQQADHTWKATDKLLRDGNFPAGYTGEKGYTGLGWYQNDETELYDLSPTTEVIKAVTGAKTVFTYKYAPTTPQTYTVVLHLEGGSYTTTPDTYTENSDGIYQYNVTKTDAVINPESPSRNNFGFEGWSLSESAPQTLISEDATFANLYLKQSGMSGNFDKIDLYAVWKEAEPPTPADPVEWDVSCSKIASGLMKNSNGDWTTDVTLSIPSSEKQLVSDVLFILDESSCSESVKASVNSMLDALYEQIENSGAKIKVGAVQFRGNVTTLPLTELTENTKTEITSFMSSRPEVGGTNMSAGLLKAQKMLDDDTSVMDGRKYVILVSDGITYIWDDETTDAQENLGVNFANADAPNNAMLAGPDGWDVKYGESYIPENWESHFNGIDSMMSTTIQNKASNYERGDNATIGKPFVAYGEKEQYTSTVDIALYKSYNAYKALQEKYNTYAVCSGVEKDMTDFPFGPSFMTYLADGKNVTFNSIQNDILYAVSAGSTVTDTIGEKFTFGGVDSFTLTVGNNKITGTVDGNTVNFGNVKQDKSYPYTVTYTPDTKTFVWTINENVSNFAPVQLTYTVKLTNPQTAAGTYGVTDLNGDEKVDDTGAAVDKTKALYTNQEAKLVPKDSNGNTGVEQTFPMPSVSYTIKGSSGGHGGNGGGTVTIPDDVPTGLNGKDHYAYVVGYPDGMVYPQKNITRAEVATIFFRLLKDETREANMTKSNGYNDMKDGAWYTCAVSTLSKMGIIKGYEDGSFKPDASISRAEFAAIAARFDPDGDKTPATFSDVSSHWAKDEISIAANHGWIKGYEDGSFKPDQKITRAETMTLVNRVLKRLPETKDDLHKDMKTWPDNQNESAWFYLAVQEATNSHYQKLKKDGTHETWESMRETRDWAALEK